MTTRRRSLLYVAVAGGLVAASGSVFGLGIHLTWAGWVVMLAALVRMI